MKCIRKFTPVSPYDIQGLESWLQDLALQGLYLTRFQPLFSTFVQDTPRRVRYRVEFCKEADQDGPPQDLKDLYSDFGWDYMGRAWDSTLLIFRTRDSRAEEPHTDPPLQGELLEKLQSARLHMARSQSKRLELLRRRLEALALKRVLTDPVAVLQDKRMLLAHLQKDLGYAAEAQLAGPRRRLEGLAASLDAMSPLKVLGRGFAVAADENGQILRRAADAAPGDRVRVTLAEGRLDCRVETVYTEEEQDGREKREEL